MTLKGCVKPLDSDPRIRAAKFGARDTVAIPGYEIVPFREFSVVRAAISLLKVVVNVIG
jgi:hypothetical protein